ncbi:MAG: uracil-DNA glycosylase family protein, partial [Desulfomonilaceae bacterium]
MNITGELEKYYKDCGISPHDFHCKNVEVCRGQNPRFTEANQAFVGTEYEKGTLPRLLFLSLDSGENGTDPERRSMAAYRQWEENELVVSDLDKAKHWYETHKFAWKILKKFESDLTLEGVKPYFAHTNSAKCCENNPGRSQARDVLFTRCREHIFGEIEILSPDILITQGNQTKAAIDHCFEVISSNTKLENCPVKTLEISNKNVIWVYTYHPRHGVYFTQKRNCWD